ncbi:DUF2062 domain-containing protein [Geothrix fermentans]|jgi:uncharacterized protein (DUF2062 family)|uniref:DUF2062 domain-containing protein n=1 Tax=Geothrix fermentans TaxID=44676 RepID=UPI0003F823E1|nr:DUF2062 domain-containing protein [Geothrix fermentans]
MKHRDKTHIWARTKRFLADPDLEPHHLAWSFALGFSIAWNPLLGTHTAIILVACALVKKLHRPLTFLGAFTNNPWTMVPMATGSALLGNLLLGRGLHLDLSGVDWKSFGWHSFATREGFQAAAAMLKPILAPYLLGGFVMSALALPVGYFLMLRLAHRLRRPKPAPTPLPGD